jgi:hypothetical protein
MASGFQPNLTTPGASSFRGGHRLLAHRFFRCQRQSPRRQSPPRRRLKLWIDMPDVDFSKLPNHGWILDDVVDLGDLAGACQPLRYRDPVRTSLSSSDGLKRHRRVHLLRQHHKRCFLWNCDLRQSSRRKQESVLLACYNRSRQTMEQFDRTHVPQNWTTRRRQKLVDVYLVAHQPSLAVWGGNVS